MTRIFGTVLAALLLTSVAQARPGHRPPPPHQQLADNAAELGLSQDDVAKVQAAFEARQDQMRTLHEQMRAAHEAQDQAAMEAAREQMRALHMSAMDEATSGMSQQSAQAIRGFFEEQRAEREANRGERRGPPPGQQPQ
jgi:hypothetical protein